MPGPPTVVAATKIVRVGGASYGRETIAIDLAIQSVADVRWVVQDLITTDSAQQEAIGNPPQILTVDGQLGKPLADVQKTASVTFGASLAVTAMRTLELALISAIDRSTDAHSGTLRNVGASWVWLFIPKGGAARPVTAAGGVVSFAAGDTLALVPRLVPYATIVNRNVRRSGTLTAKVRKTHNAASHIETKGFLGIAARSVRRHREFKDFSIAADFTRRGMVAGEVMTRTEGTGYLKIQPRLARKSLF